MSATATSVGAVVLAAGRSTRMGRAKPLLPFADGTVIAHVVGALRAGGIDPVHVVVGHRGDAVAAALAGSGAIVVDNPDYDLGMYSSLRTGIASLPEALDGVLLLPGDVPAVRPPTFARIAAAGRAAGTVVHPTFRGERGHPPYLPRAIFAEILAGNGEGGLRAVLARHAGEAGAVAVFDRACLHDMDHPVDHERLAAALVRRHAPEPEECEAILDDQATPDPIRRHCRAVAARAVEIAERLNAAGAGLDLDLVRAGALLHDVAKGRTDHAAVGAGIVAALGFPAVGAVIGRHMWIDFAPGDPIDEAVVVHLADKRVAGDRRVTLAERFAAIEGRFADDPAALAAARRRRVVAAVIEAAVAARIDLDAPIPDGDTAAPGPSPADEPRIPGCPVANDG